MLATMKTQQDRFWEKVEKRDDGCWIWLGSKGNKDHGLFWHSEERKLIQSHRLAWMWANGPIPAGLFVHHICRNGLCVNADHLQLMTRTEHEREHRKTHCIRGHRLVEKWGEQVCDTCRRDFMRRKRAAQRVARGYGRYETLRGSHNKRSKVTEDDVLYIRSMKGKVMGKDLAAKFGISPAQVSGIQSGREWSWL